MSKRGAITERAQGRLRVTLGWLLVLVTGVGLYMSWPALYDAAINVGGMPPERAIAFPIVVDLVTVTAMLLVLLVENPEKHVRIFTWSTLAVYGVITILGNASETALVDPDQLVLGYGPAVVVNAIPGVSILVAVHLASVNVFRRVPEPVVKSAAPVAPMAMRRPRAVTKSHDPAKKAEVIRLRADEKKSLSAIADITGVPKATVSRWTSDVTADQEGTAT